MSEKTIVELKKSKTIKERINTLNKRNLEIDDYNLIYNYIKSINTYYHLTGYRFLLDNYDFKKDDYHKHKCTELIALCEMDKRLSLMFFEQTRRIEEAIRTRLANLCGKDDIVTFKIDDNHKEALLEDNYCMIHNSKEKFIAETLYNDNVKKVLYNDINKTREEPAIKHYINEYNGIIPIWVVVNFISFGTLIKLIDCLTSIKLDNLMERKTI
jgi:abortive infection bacteriophage resistance protein